MSNRPQKITFAEMREQKGLRGNLIYCADYHCSHSTAISADRWPDDMRLSDIEPLFVCKACGQARRRRQAGLLLPSPAAAISRSLVVPASIRTFNKFV
jgi:hypothetical protein